MDAVEVQAKATAARTWCDAASGHARDYGGKPWAYLLIPHAAIQENMTLKGLVAAYGTAKGVGLVPLHLLYTHRTMP